MHEAIQTYIEKKQREDAIVAAKAAQRKLFAFGFSKSET